MKKRRSVLLLALLLGSGGRAQAWEIDPNPRPAFRAYLAAGAGPMFGLALSIDGRPVTEPNDSAVNASVDLGLDYQVARWLSLGGEVRYGTWNSSWAERVGYNQEKGGDDRSGVDLDGLLRILAPPVRDGSLSLRFSLAPSAGLTFPVAPNRRTQAVRESWEPRLGANAGLALEGEWWHQPLGARWKFGLSASVLYTRHWMTLDAMATPISDPASATSARFRYVTDTLFVRVGLLAGL